MKAEASDIEIEKLRNIVRTMGWRIVQTDTRNATITVTLVHEEPQGG